MRYIIIDETGEVYKTNKITDEDKNACDDGLLDIIDCKEFKSYYQREWHEIQKWEEYK